MNQFLTNPEFKQIIVDMGQPTVMCHDSEAVASWRAADGTLTEMLWVNERLVRRWVNHVEMPLNVGEL